MGKNLDPQLLLRTNTIVILNKKNNQEHLLKETHVPGINDFATHNAADGGVGMRAVF